MGPNIPLSGPYWDGDPNYVPEPAVYSRFDRLKAAAFAGAAAWNAVTCTVAAQVEMDTASREAMASRFRSVTFKREFMDQHPRHFAPNPSGERPSGQFDLGIYLSPVIRGLALREVLPPQAEVDWIAWMTWGADAPGPSPKLGECYRLLCPDEHDSDAMVKDLGKWPSAGKLVEWFRGKGFFLPGPFSVITGSAPNSFHVVERPTHESFLRCLPGDPIGPRIGAAELPGESRLGGRIKRPSANDLALRRRFFRASDHERSYIGWPIGQAPADVRTIAMADMDICYRLPSGYCYLALLGPVVSTAEFDAMRGRLGEWPTAGAVAEWFKRERQAPLGVFGGAVSIAGRYHVWYEADSDFEAMMLPGEEAPAGVDVHFIPADARLGGDAPPRGRGTGEHLPPAPTAPAADESVAETPLAVQQSVDNHFTVRITLGTNYAGCVALDAVPGIQDLLTTWGSVELVSITAQVVGNDTTSVLVMGLSSPNNRRRLPHGNNFSASAVLSADTYATVDARSGITGGSGAVLALPRDRCDMEISASRVANSRPRPDFAVAFHTDGTSFAVIALTFAVGGAALQVVDPGDFFGAIQPPATAGGSRSSGR